ncbi:MFS transporter [Trinickia mobilis]|uniref:MFS transporter n=1 Tax=Trinickia mobilis TaxID=2816356 RepID=UPI001A8F7AB3|nr:MFS transporter [Trinickia mobilis]
MNIKKTQDPVWLAELACGWPVLLAATIGCGAGMSSLPFYSLGSFVEPLNHAFGWSRAAVSACFLYLTLTLAVVGPLLGWVIDRVGTRTVALLSIPCLSAFFYALSAFSGALWTFQMHFVAVALVGGGTTPILYTRAVCTVFDGARGRALGITLAGTGVAALLLPKVLSGIIAAHGWQGGFIALAVTSALPWPFVFFCFPRGRTQNESMVQVEPESKPDSEPWCSFQQAVRTRVFWTIAAGFMCIAVAVSALVVHLVPYLVDRGFSGSEAASVASLMGVGVLVGRLLVGWLIDRFFAPRVALILFSITAAGCLLLMLGGNKLASLTALLIGLSLGAEVDMISFLTSRYFGMRSYGRLYAVVYSAFVVGAAIGPVLAGRLFDLQGNYQQALWMVIVLLLVGAGAISTLPGYSGFRERVTALALRHRNANGQSG